MPLCILVRWMVVMEGIRRNGVGYYGAVSFLIKSRARSNWSPLSPSPGANLESLFIILTQRKDDCQRKDDSLD